MNIREKTRYEVFIGAKRRMYVDRFDESGLAPQFIEHYNTGYRIEVTTTYPNGETYVRRGRVGVTTGWRPAFLLLGPNDVVTKIINRSAS